MVCAGQHWLSHEMILKKYVFLCVGSLQTRSGDVRYGSARGGFHIFCTLRGAGQQRRGHEERAHQGKPISTKHIMLLFTASMNDLVVQY